jgi:hypothetical protein
MLNALISKIDLKNPIHMYAIIAIIIWMIYLINGSRAYYE